MWQKVNEKAHVVSADWSMIMENNFEFIYVYTYVRVTSKRLKRVIGGEIDILATKVTTITASSNKTPTHLLYSEIDARSITTAAVGLEPLFLLQMPQDSWPGPHQKNWSLQLRHSVAKVNGHWPWPGREAQKLNLTAGWEINQAPLRFANQEKGLLA